MTVDLIFITNTNLHKHPIDFQCYIAAFLKLSDKSYEWSGTMMEQPQDGCVWLYSFIVLNNDLQSEFAFILVSFEP